MLADGLTKGGRRGSRMKEDTATPTNQFLKQERATQTMNNALKVKMRIMTGLESGLN